ncbi:protein phosphatase 2C 56-like [Telopea speciosissima]|uniref:protein phosphatase 2C 56-like n=1 Tax=Telopea speciosissima TaxID=54955 RepID=UPI001CC4CF62|nr:protein phosphatase 2C 56-like [Telopea speciosissima]
MDSVDDEDLFRADEYQRESDLTSTDSGVSSLFTGEDSTSSTDISGSSSGSSGEISASVVEGAVMVPNLLLSPTPSAGDVGKDGRQKCVGRNNKGVTWGFTSITGRRREMEDAVAIIPGFMSSSCDHVGGCTAPGSRIPGEISPVHFFGVYDGHGGSQVAKFCAERIHEVVAEEWGRVVSGDCWRRRWEVAFSTGFERADNEVVAESIAPEMVGSTAVVVAVSGCQIITSNCGDSRAVLCRGTQTIPLTVDHKPDREDELVRIEGGGGRVINWNGARIFGVLAMSRSIGDRYMRPWIIPVPEVTFTTRSEEDDCLIVASDGLWDVMTNDEVGEVARQLFRRRRRSTMADGSSSPPAQYVADHLTNVAYKRNSSDNISVIVVDLKPKRRRPQRHY